MACYKIYCSDHILRENDREDIALRITALHSETTNSPPGDVKVLYHHFGLWDLWSGGKRAQKYVRVEADCKANLSSRSKFSILQATHEIVRDTLGDRAPEVEIQTRIVETQTSESVMTNGRIGG